jgi:hypothetical protein
MLRVCIAFLQNREIELTTNRAAKRNARADRILKIRTRRPHRGKPPDSYQKTNFFKEGLARNPKQMRPEKRDTLT